MKKANTADRLKEVMKERSLRQIDVLDKAKPFCDKYGIKLTKSDLSQYVNGKVDPGQEKLTILGLALDVSEAWLMGFDVSKERKINKEQPTNISELSNAKQMLIDYAYTLSDEQAILALRVLKSISEVD